MICSGVLAFLGIFTPLIIYQSNIKSGLILGGQVRRHNLETEGKKANGEPWRDRASRHACD